MKFKPLFALLLAGATASGAFAQTHVEGVEYYKADQFANAKELLERNYNNAGTDKAISDYYLGLIDMENGDLTSAAAHFNKGVQANPDYGYNYIGLGAIELKNGDVKVAEKLFKEGEGKAKKDPSMNIAVARAYYWADPVKYGKEIDKRIEKSRRKDISNPEIYIFEGDRLADNKQWGEAGSKYEMAANYDNNATEAYVKYADLFTQVNPGYAIAMLQKLLQLNPESALGQRELANAYYNNSDFAKAAEMYGKYVKNPNHFKQDEDRYAFLLFYSGDYDKGYQYSSNLLKADSRNFTAQRYQFMNAAQIPAMREQLLPMAEALYAAHKSGPANKFAPIDYTLIAEEFQNAKRPDEALAVLQEAVKEMPNNAAFNKQMAFVYVDENNLPGAADSFSQYLEKLDEPGYNDFVQQAMFDYFAGIDRKSAGDAAKSDAYFADAAAYAEKAAKILPDNYKPKKIVGDIAKQKATKENLASAAAPIYIEAVQMLEASADPSRYASDAKEMYNYLGNYYLDLKDNAKAKEYFNKYLQYDPDNADYRKFVESIK